MWRATPSNLFTVKLAYDLLEVDHRQWVSGERSNVNALRWMCRKVWKLGVLGKFKNLLLKPYHVILLTHFNLH